MLEEEEEKDEEEEEDEEKRWKRNKRKKKKMKKSHTVHSWIPINKIAPPHRKPITTNVFNVHPFSPLTHHSISLPSSVTYPFSLPNSKRGSSRRSLSIILGQEPNDQYEYTRHLQNTDGTSLLSLFFSFCLSLFFCPAISLSLPLFLFFTRLFFSFHLIWSMVNLVDVVFKFVHSVCIGRS